jgi:hypothetical protein
MSKTFRDKNGFRLRIIECKKCNEIIVHPQDMAEYDNFQKLKKKNYRVKLRLVGNSYAVSIPKEIVNFMNAEENKIREMVDLCFEDFKRISLNFD